MPELVITYKNRKTLQMLLDLAKYFDFKVVKEEKKDVPTQEFSGITIVEGDPSIDTSDLTGIFTGKNIDAKALRQSAWERRK